MNNHKCLGIEGLFAVVRSIAIYLCIPFFIKFYDLPKLIAQFTPKGAGEKKLSQLTHYVQTIEKIVHFLRYRLKFKQNYCLRKSIVLFYHLQRYNIPAVINIGLKVDAYEQACGHCWISVREHVLFERSDVYQQYNVFLGQSDAVNYWISL